MKGRHRRGSPAVQVARREWDRDQRSQAARIDQAEAGWTVMYGVGGRRFYAIATTHVPEPQVVEARTAEELHELIRETGPAMPPPAVLHRHGRGAPMIASTPDGLRTVGWELPCDPAITHEARRMVRETFTTWRLPSDLVDDAVLVVSELVTNAAVYGGPPVRLSLWAMPEGVCVRVTDHGLGRPHRLDLGQDATSGRGLAIVEALADQWGVIPVRDRVGKTVWAAWRLPCGRSDVPRTAECADPLPRSRLRV
ncbi:ATP-binding protein [Streptosporangium sp. NBC_01639]|uniref:ATP-binding protein n=1 Tax=Streptosporangium sp. NBC_01639 TaxID=2975948 RepID=UPI00386C1BA8|nr:ATP-binding protein [Streptosporangium sp. NBC_01639]